MAIRPLEQQQFKKATKAGVLLLNEIGCDCSSYGKGAVAFFGLIDISIFEMERRLKDPTTTSEENESKVQEFL